MALYSNHFYHSLLRKYVIAFGTLFSNIQVVRSDEAGGEFNRETVGLTYSPKEKFYVRLKQDGNLDRRPAIKLPKMAFQIEGMNYSPERKTNSHNKFSLPDPNDADKKEYVYSPVPWDINFSLSVMAKRQDEGLQIIEQILPFFTPTYTLKLKGIENPDISFNVPIDLVSAAPDDQFEGSFDERRVIVWNLDFLMKAYFFGPSRSSGIIKDTRIGIYGDEDFQNKWVDIQLEPYIDGTPVSDIASDDDYEITTTITEFP